MTSRPLPAEIRPTGTVTRARGMLRRPVLAAVLVYICALPVFLNWALPVYTSTQRLLAWVIFAVAGIPFFKAMASPTRGVPLVPLIAGQYIVFYSLAVFFEDSVYTQSGWIVPASAAVDMALFCSLLSFIAIGLGYFVGGRVLRLRFEWIHFTPSPQRLFWYAVVTLLGGAFFSLGQGTLFGWSTADISRPIGVILSTDLGIAILACLYYYRLLSGWQKLVAVGLVCMSVIFGFAGGMFQSVVQPLLVWALCRWVIKGKAPVMALVFIASTFFVLQPVKGPYRELALLSGRSFTTTEKLSIYRGLIERQWLTPGSNTNGVASQNRESAKKRLSLLLATAHYVEWTPYPFEYRNGSTLGYLIYGWIPRFAWPDKPIAQEANKALPVEYDFQNAANQGVTMFGVGHLAEAYVNFGLAGIFPIFLFMGILYRIPQLVLGRVRTIPSIALFVAVAVLMVPIGSSISDAFGGFVQQLLLQAFLLRVLTRQRGRTTARSRAFVSPAAHPVAGGRLVRRHSLASGHD